MRNLARFLNNMKNLKESRFFRPFSRRQLIKPLAMSPLNLDDFPSPKKIVSFDDRLRERHRILKSELRGEFCQAALEG